MLLRRFGGRRRLDLFFFLLFLFWERQRALVAWCPKKGAHVFFSGSVWLSIGHGLQLDNWASEKGLGTAGPQKYYSNVSKKQVAW